MYLHLSNPEALHFRTDTSQKNRAAYYIALAFWMKLAPARL